MVESQIVQMLITGQNDLEWYDSNLGRLQNQFNNKFIAFRDGDIIDSDSNLNSLMDKLNKKGMDTSAILIKFVSKVKCIRFETIPPIA